MASNNADPSYVAALDQLQCTEKNLLILNDIVNIYKQNSRRISKDTFNQSGLTSLVSRILPNERPISNCTQANKLYPNFKNAYTKLREERNTKTKECIKELICIESAKSKLLEACLNSVYIDGKDLSKGKVLDDIVTSVVSDILDETSKQSYQELGEGNQVELNQGFLAYVCEEMELEEKSSQKLSDKLYQVMTKFMNNSDGIADKYSFAKQCTDILKSIGDPSDVSHLSSQTSSSSEYIESHHDSSLQAGTNTLDQNGEDIDALLTGLLARGNALRNYERLGSNTEAVFKVACKLNYFAEFLNDAADLWLNYGTFLLWKMKCQKPREGYFRELDELPTLNISESLKELIARAKDVVRSDSMSSCLNAIDRMKREILVLFLAIENSEIDTLKGILRALNNLEGALNSDVDMAMQNANSGLVFDPHRASIDISRSKRKISGSEDIIATFSSERKESKISRKV